MDSTVAEIGGLSTRASPFSGPAYYDNDTAPSGPPGAGLPPTASAQHVENRNPNPDPDVTEIHLSPTPQDAMDTGHESGALHQEMVETGRHEPFVPGLQQQQQRRNNESDAPMEDVRGATR